MEKDALRVIGTHHKTGTVLMYKAFRDIGRALGYAFFTGPQEELPPETSIWLEDHSHIDPERLDRPLLGVHLIRHPYDIIASAYRYHLVCTEEWCTASPYAEPAITEKPEYQKLFSDGRSYQKALNSLPPPEGLVLEIWRSRPNILYMAAWDYADPRFLECKLEDFSRDFDGTFRKILAHLRFPDPHIAEALEIAAQHDTARWSDGKLRDEPHVTNKSRKAGHGDLFNTEHFRLMGELFPEDLLDRLGYELEIE